MKASPAGHDPVCPVIPRFTFPGFPRTDTSDVSNAIFSTSENRFHLDSPSHDFPSLDNAASVAMVGGFHKFRKSSTGCEETKNCLQVDEVGRPSISWNGVKRVRILKLENKKP
jgi:hypothetical protein